MPVPDDNDMPAILGGPPVFPDGPPAWPAVDPRVCAVLREVATDGSWGRYHGGNCERFAAAFREYLGCEHVELCASGTAAIELALRGLKVTAGREVILAAYDYRAAFRTVQAIGARPVLVDVDPRNCAIDVAALEAAMTDDAAAIIVSHLHGGMADMSRVMEVAERRGVPVIEDACQATGAAIAGRRAGTLGTLGVFSFGGSKLLTAGRGGAVAGHSAREFQRMRLYAFRGNDAYPLSELQAAVLLPQLAQLDERNDCRARRVGLLTEGRHPLPGLNRFENSVADAEPAWYKVGLRYDSAALDGLSRAAFCRAMRADGVACDEGFGAVHRTVSRSRYRSTGLFPGADEAHETVVQIHHPILLQDPSTIAEVRRAVCRVAAYAAEIRAREKGSATE